MASLEPRIIETGSYMLHCDFKGVNDKHTELVVGIISKFSVAIKNLVLEHHIDIESDFSIWETSKPNTITSERTIKVEINDPGVDFLPDEDRNALVDSAYDAGLSLNQKRPNERRITTPTGWYHLQWPMVVLLRPNNVNPSTSAGFYFF